MANQKQLAVATMIALVLCAGVGTMAQAQGAADAKKRGGEILAEAAAAAGGDALKRVETLQLAAAGSANSPMGSVSVELRVQIGYPDRMRSETTVRMSADPGAAPAASFLQGFDGKAAWLVSPQGTMDMPPEFNKENLRAIDLSGGIGLYKKALAATAEAEFSGEKDFAGQKTLLVEWAGPSGKVKLYFDPTTKLLAGAKYQASTMQGYVEEERRVSDYRDVDGVKFPFHWVTYRDGALYSDLTLKELKFNEKMDAATFAKPQ